VTGATGLVSAEAGYSDAVESVAAEARARHELGLRQGGSGTVKTGEEDLEALQVRLQVAEAGGAKGFR